MKEEIEKLQEQVKILREQISSLMNIFGFAGYIDSFITDDDSDIHIISGDYKKLDKNKLPVKSQDFNLLLEYLKLNIQDEKIERKIVLKNKK